MPFSHLTFEAFLTHTTHIHTNILNCRQLGDHKLLNYMCVRPLPRGEYFPTPYTFGAKNLLPIFRERKQ